MLQNNLQNYIEPTKTLPSNPTQPRSPFGYSVWKRLIDIVVSACVLVIITPVLFVLGVIIKLDSKGPVFFQQKRVGQNGKLFTCLKLRSMYTNADPEVHRRYVQAFMQNSAPLLPSAQPHAAESANTTTTAPVFKLMNDPRVTRIGHFLRKSSLDELPQFWNVLKGEMSLVGPRPALPYEVENYDPVQRQRLSVPQGITGWWQVYGRSRVTFDQVIEMDLQYVAHRSLKLDLGLLVKTIPAMLSSKGAH